MFIFLEHKLQSPRTEQKLHIKLLDIKTIKKKANVYFNV